MHFAAERIFYSRKKLQMLRLIFAKFREFLKSAFGDFLRFPYFLERLARNTIEAKIKSTIRITKQTIIEVKKLNRARTA